MTALKKRALSDYTAFHSHFQPLPRSSHEYDSGIRLKVSPTEASTTIIGTGPEEAPTQMIGSSGFFFLFRSQELKTVFQDEGFPPSLCGFDILTPNILHVESIRAVC
jgi:hypothetical protein